MHTLDFLVRKDQLSSTEIRQTPDQPLREGEVRLRIDRFALTANNITYAAFGEAMHYWDFFPVAQADAEDTSQGWGRIPVWGFASVVQSLHPAIAVGETLYGYFPMSSHVVLAPKRVTPDGFVDGAAHRAALHPVYNQYLRTSRDPFYTAQTQDLQALLRPLFITSWLIDDFLNDSHFFGVQADGSAESLTTLASPGLLLLSSASSKTAYGTAFQLAQRPGLTVVGLTSPANIGFCESLGCYHQVLSYAQLAQLDAQQPCVYIDFAGNASLRHDIHSRFTQLKFSSAIGGTHVDQLGGAQELPGPRATLFFAPAQIKKRHTDWGAEVLGQRLLASWQAFLTRVSHAQSPWLKVQHHQGPDAVQAVYRAVLSGQCPPQEGHMLSL